MNMVSLCIWAIVIILMNNPFGQPCRARISSTYLIYSRVIIQKSVLKILHDYSIFLAMSFIVSNTQYSEFSMVIIYSSLCLSEIAMPSIQKFLIIGLLHLYSVLSGFSLSSVLWSILRELICMHIGNSTTNSSSRSTSCHAGFYIILWILVLWISRDFISFASQSEISIIDYLTKSAHFTLF